MTKPRIACVVGTRPDTIKNVPVFIELKKFADRCDPVLVATGQHREMMDQALAAFEVRPDIDLDIMQVGQTLAEVTSRALDGLERVFKENRPDFVIAQGDTATTFVASLAAFYHRIPFGHVEAGLRTPTVQDPFPEEFYRRASALITHQHYPPTQWAKQNLLREHHDPETIFVTGNTGIDAVLRIAEAQKQDWLTGHEGRVFVLTTHRRENWGEPQRRIAEACLALVERYPDSVLVAAMHRNPIVRETLTSVLGGHPRIQLIEPPEYARFVKLMQRATLILTDSGGVQEEAPAFGIPVLVLRETTERPEGVESGNAKLVGTDKDLIYSEAVRLLDEPAAYASMSAAASPYGDGLAAPRIRYLALKSLGVESPEVPMWEL